MSRVVICGRPNVGKSTLFNQLTRKMRALVHDRPNITRDWIEAGLGDLELDLVDTAGFDAKTEEELHAQASDRVVEQVKVAVLVLFVVDARAGLTAQDEEFAQLLRKVKEPEQVITIVNKSENQEPAAACAEFYGLGFDETFAIAAAHKQGLRQLTAYLRERLEPAERAEPEALVRITVLGRPNVGKSTLTNALLGQERMIVSDLPGTTVDTVANRLVHRGHTLELVDTAGVRRRARVDDAVERESGRYARQAAEQADIVIFMVDASEGVVHQDQLLAQLVAGYGRATVVVLNKDDLIDQDERRRLKAKARRDLGFMKHAQLLMCSVAAKSFRPGKILDVALASLEDASQRVSAQRMSNVLKAVTAEHTPPRSQGRRPALRYAHQGGINPPLVVIHGRHVDLIKEPYLRYLADQFASRLGFKGAPVQIRLKESVARSRT